MNQEKVKERSAIATKQFIVFEWNKMVHDNPLRLSLLQHPYTREACQVPLPLTISGVKVINIAPAYRPRQSILGAYYINKNSGNLVEGGNQVTAKIIIQSTR
jgi:hypothetical protein